MSEGGTSCGFNQQAYNPCRNRHCPKCQFVKQEQWADKLAHNLLPCKYFHVVFTLPEELRGLVFYNKEVCCSLLFKASSGALLQAAPNPDFLGARAGALAVLHTWTQTLLFHPHIHMLVPAGGLSEDGMEWKSSRKKFFLPAKVLSRIFRGTMVKLLEGAVEEGTINLPHTVPVFSELKDKLYKKDWNVHLEKAFRGVNSVPKYLGRYTHRVAIANSRLVSISESNVSFRYKDNKGRGRKKSNDAPNQRVYQEVPATCPAQEFLYDQVYRNFGPGKFKNKERTMPGFDRKGNVYTCPGRVERHGGCRSNKTVRSLYLP